MANGQEAGWHSRTGGTKMEFGLREALISVGFLVIAAILLDGWRRMRQARQGELGMPSDMGGSCDDDWEYYRGELPNGGARKVELRQEPGLSDADELPPQFASRPDNLEQTPSLEMHGTEPEFGDADLGSFDMSRSDDLDTVGKARPARRAATPADNPLFEDDDALLRARADQEHRLQKHSRDKVRRQPDPEPVKARSVAAEEEGNLKLDVESVQDVIVVNVMARHGQEFLGTDLQRVLQSCGFHHGEMNIYHRFEQHNGRGGLLFSVANVIEPGTFDPENMEDFVTPGVCLFMKLPGPKRAVSAFDVMIDSARKLASQMGGDMKDEHHSVMTQQTIEHYRQRVLDFERKMLSQRALPR